MKIKVLISSIVVIGFSFNFTFASSFSDLSSSHANYDAIEYVKSNNIVNGYEDGSFKPNDSINRAEFTKIVIASQFDTDFIENCINQNVESSSEYVIFSDV